MRPASRTDRTTRRVAGVRRRLGTRAPRIVRRRLRSPAPPTPPPPRSPIVLDGQGAAFDGTVEITCESPAVADADGVDIGSATRGHAPTLLGARRRHLHAHDR